MKFTSTLFAVAIATGVSATAIPEAEAYGNALTNKVRRAADAFAEAVAGPEVLLDARCESEECFMARLKTRELASLVAMTVRDASPEAFIQSLGLRDETNLRRDADAWCTNHPGTICSKEKREAEAWCTNHPGTICAREAEAWCTNHPGTICQREASCFDAGAPCEKLKRAAEAVAEALAVEKRDAWCTNHPGTICGKEKREADAWCTNHPGTICAKEKREAEAWCTNHPGTICAKSKREADALASAWCTNHPGTICAKAKRDAFALASAANEIIAGLS